MSQGGEKAIKAALLANFSIAAMKLAGALLSGSASIFLVICCRSGHAFHRGSFFNLWRGSQDNAP